MPGANQRSITVHRAMYEEVERLVQADRALYASVADFAESAIRAEVRRARARAPPSEAANLRST